MDSILIIDDEPAIRELIRFTLESAGFSAREAGHAEEARQCITTEKPALILLDWMLPGRSGIELAEELKKNSAYKKIPIIMLTAKGEETDKVKGLEAGADDYITKPFSPLELVARIKAVLRRSNTEEVSDVITFDGLQLDTIGHRLSIDNLPVETSPTEFRLLHFFMTHPERAFSRTQLLDHVWGNDVYVEERTVDVHVRRLRKILEPAGYHRFLQTVRSIGYRFSITN